MSERTSALLLFHLRVGVRLALLRLAPAGAALAVLFVFLKPEFFLIGVLNLSRSGGVILGGVSALIAWAFALRSAPRIVINVGGWIRHLPLEDRSQRRALQAGLWLAQLPVGLAMAGIFAWAGVRYGTLDAAYPIGIPVMLWAVGSAVLPLENIRWMRWPALAAGALAASGVWIFLAVGLFLLVLTERFAGPIAGPDKTTRVGFRWPAALLPYVILWRALQWRLSLAYLLAMSPLALTGAYLANNTETSLQTLRAQLFGTSMAVVVFSAVTANLIATRRPVWPWARSLPGSALRRVLEDSLFLWVHGLPLWLPLLISSPKTGSVLSAGLPAFALYSAAAVRRAPVHRTGGLGLIFLKGTLGGMLMTLVPASALILLGSIPLILYFGERLDRKQKAGLWLDYHHLAAGDPHSWSRQ